MNSEMNTQTNMPSNLSSNLPQHTRFPVASGRATFAHLGTMLRDKKAQLALTVVVLTAAAWCGVWVPKLMGQIVDAVRGGAGEQVAQSTQIGHIALVMLLAVIGSAVFGAWGFALAARIAENMIADLREDMVATTLRLPVARVEAAGSGDIVSRASDDVAEVSTAVTQVLPVATTAIFTLLVSIVGVGSVHPAYMLAFVVVLPVHFFAFRRYLRTAPPVYAAERAAMAERAGELLSTIGGRSAVRAFALEGVRSAKIAHWSWMSVRYFVDCRVTHNVIMGWMHAAEFLGMASTLILGFYLVDGGVSSIGGAMAAMLLFMRLFGPLTRMVFVLDIAQSGFTALNRIVGVLESRPASHGEAHVLRDRGVEVRGAEFSYDSKLALLPTDLTIPAGQTFALVGTSGAGKSTLAALIAGLRVADTGEVWAAGCDMVHDSEASRGKAVVLVTQEGHIFEGTLAEDLRLVAPNATDTELYDALVRVGASWARSLPDGLDTVVGHGGYRLSPVQAQQIALARVLLANPPVVVLDEATAEAGTSGAAVLGEASAEVVRGRTALVVAHRLDQAEAADQVVVMEQGRIVEQGSHSDLIAQNGRYSRLWEAWERGR